MSEQSVKFTKVNTTYYSGIVGNQFEAMMDEANLDHRSPLFKLIKSKVKSWGHWKELPRGKPRKFGGTV